MADHEPETSGDLLSNAQSISIWDELTAWGESLSDWQRHILSHSVRTGPLNPERIDEAYLILMHGQNLIASDVELPAIPMTVTGRANSNETTPFCLKELGNLKNVNAIPNAASLKFGPNLTLIYGHNGSGKSGFSRLFSSACFGRSAGKILHNIYEDKDPIEPTEAEFKLSFSNAENSAEEKISFRAGVESKTLRRIKVFDSSVAAIHLTKENELAFRPTGFDVFDELVRAIGIVAEKIETEISKRTRENKFINLFSDSGSISHQISELSSKTDIEKLRELARFGAAEDERLAEIAREEIELSNSSPTEALATLKDANTNLVGLRAKWTERASLLVTARAQALRLLDQQIAVAFNVTATKERIERPSQLTQIGTDAWEKFLSAGRELGKNERESYPEETDLCLLCHRPLDEPTVTLIKRMWGFLDDTSRATALNIDTELNDLCATLKSIQSELLPTDSRQRLSISKFDPELVASLDELSEALKMRRDLIVAAIETGNKTGLETADLTPPDSVFEMAFAEIKSRELALGADEFSAVSQRLKAEHINLRQRQVLSKNVDEIVAFVEDLRWIEKAKGLKRTSTNPKFVTDKQHALFQSVVGTKYKTLLEDECKKLDCELPYEFKARGSVGKTLRGLKAQGGYKPDEIFSEGEQRALALADFLTEVKINPSSTAIVLDDPVTSLDHRRKRAIAKRLVEEASGRQVIVFTHDLVFLTLLQECAEKAEIDSLSHWIERRDNQPGYVNINESPSNSKDYRKTTKAKAFLAEASSATGAKRVDLIRSAAGALRRTLEETVQHHLFKDTIRRWNEQVRLGTLNKIAWSNEIADEIVDLQDATSRIVEGHSNSDEFSGAFPDIDAVQPLVARVDTVIRLATPSR